jgi:hypothetical protein
MKQEHHGCKGPAGQMSRGRALVHTQHPEEGHCHIHGQWQWVFHAVTFLQWGWLGFMLPHEGCRPLTDGACQEWKEKQEEKKKKTPPLPLSPTHPHTRTHNTASHSELNHWHPCSVVVVR